MSPLLEPRVGDDLDAIAADTADDDTTWDSCEVRGDCAAVEAADVEICASRVRAVTLTGSHFERLRVTDTVFEGCEFSGAFLEEAVLTRVAFLGCRMTGLLLPGAKLRDVRFHDCRLDEANLRLCVGERVGFESTTMRRTDLHGSVLTGAHIFDCDLSEAQFSDVRLRGARLHGSRLDDLKGSDSLRGVVIDSTQIVPLALSVFDALGISLDDERDAPAN